MEKLSNVGKYNTDYNTVVGCDFEERDIYVSSGLKTHLINRKHYSAAKHFDSISDIISSPDYIGVNNDSIEYVKQIAKNFMIAIKLDSSGSFYYVATMFEVTQNKIDRFMKTGRWKRVIDK